jgi:NADH-quinone oxidoreductase subunit C
MLTNQFIQQKLTEVFAEAVSDFTESYGMLTFNCTKENNLKVLTYLKENSEMGFVFLNDLTAAHYPQREGAELEVIYLLQNMKHAFRIRMKCQTAIATPDVYTATSLYSTANWLEREAYDFYGVNFVGHPDLRRIMNVDEMDYHPLRKEYPLEDQTRMDKDDEMFGRQYLNRN